MTGEKRLALNLLILAALAALCVLAAQYPVLRLEWEARLRCGGRAPGRAERVWRGRVSGAGISVRMRTRSRGTERADLV